MRKKFLLMTFLTLLFTAMGTSVLRAQESYVAKVGDIEYATIDEAIANWTNGTTLTLLADVTLSDVIQLSSTEYHILDLGTYTMTAASGKDAIHYVVNGRSSASYALDIKADANNPGGITATGKTIVSHIKPSSNAPSKDRPITRFYGGVFNASYVVKQGGNGVFLPGAGYTGASAPYFQFYGGVFNGTIYLNRSQTQFHGGVFNGSIQMSVDTSAYGLVAGGTFKNLSNSMGSALNSDKFTIGSAKGVYDRDVYIDDNGKYVIVANKPDPGEDGIQADVPKTPGTNDYLAYSRVASEEKLGYTKVEKALNDNKSASVTVYADEIDMSEVTNFSGTIVVPADHTITITNAPANLNVVDEDGNAITPNTNGTYTTIVPDYEGEGTETSPYIIADIDDLNNLRNKVNEGEAYEDKYFELTSDITLTDAWTPIGNGARSSKTYTGYSFKGTFDGGNKTISGLTITSTSGADAAIGLFGIVDGGTVKNLNLEDVNINVASSNLAGAAIGMMLNGATADNITVSGAIIGHDGVGGIVGRLIIDGTISNCINNASVTSEYGGIGGIVGKAYYENGANTSTFASVTKCTNNGTITAPMYVGGIVGLARANVTECVNNDNGAVVGGTQTGGIIGQLIAAGEVSGNENKAKISGTNHLGGIIGDYTQSNAYTYYNVSIANNINRGEVSATQCAAIMGCNNIDGFTAMTATGNLSYYWHEGLELFATPYDMVIDETNKFIVPVAQVGEQTFYTFAEAAEAAQAGSEIILLANIEGDITVPANVTLNGNGFAISGGIFAEGDITFAGVTTAADFDANVVNTEVNIPAGASLQLTGPARLVIGHGATFNITGTIEDAKTADKATLVPSLKIAAGASITGNGVIFNVNNAYIVANANTTSKNSNANGTLDFNINNSIWEQTGVLAFYVPTSGMDPVVNFELKNSVLTTTSHLVFSVTKGEIVIDNSLVNQGTSRQIENRSTMTIKNGSVVNGAVATSSNAINPGTIIVENATYAVTGEFSGAAEGTGTLIIKKDANVSVGSIKAGANVVVDAEGMAAGDEINFTANLSQFTGTLSVINNDNLEAKIIDGNIVLVEKPVAKIGETEYATLQAALNAAAQTEELTTIQLLAGTHTFGNVKFPATLKNVTIVGADNKATIIKDSKLYSADGNAVTYKGITFDGIVFDNSSILFTGARNGEVVYEDWTIKNCDFSDLQSTDGIAAIHFNLAADETIKNFTFEKNTITNVTSPSNTASGLRLNYVTGNVVIKDNETNNVAFNAVQIINSVVDNFTFEGNILRSNGSSLANLYNVTGENIVITKNQFLVANEDQKGVSNIAYADVSGNYWGGGAPTNLPEGVVCSSYYTTVESDGTLGGLVELPQGNNFTGYTRGDAIWGEVWGNATESFVIKVLNANGNVMGTTSLNNVDGIINGNVNVTWSLMLDAASNTDEYWTMEWTTAPKINNMPAKVELWVDGVKVSGGNVVLNGPDNLNPIYAAVTDADGKILSYHTSIANAVAAITNTRSNPQGYIALLRDTDEAITLPAGIVLDKNGFIADNIVIPVASVNGTSYATLAEAVAAVQEGETIQLLAGEISEGTIKLPATLKNVTFIGAANHASVLKDMTIMAADGNSFNYEGLTFDGIQFDNSRIVFTGWRNGEETIEDLTITNCIVENLYDDTNLAFLHINKDASEPAKNLTFTNNVLNGVTGGSKSGIYSVNTGNVIIKGNTFNNIVFRPALVQLSDCDGIVDNVDISNNVISYTTRLQVYGTEVDNGDGTYTPTGTDELEVKINNNIFKNISGYYICTWGINGDYDISKNYYDSDNLSEKIYWNNEKPSTVIGLYELGVYPIYTELNEDGTINTESEYTPNIPFAQIGETGYPSLEAAAAAAQAGDEILLLANVTLSEALTTPAGITLNGNGKQINGSIVAGGDLTIKGHTKATSFNAGYNQPIITIGAGACLEMNGTGRMVIGHGATFNITGNITDAKNANVAELTPSLIMPGASFTGAGVTFNVTNAYISAPSSYCSSSSSASGTFDFNITNSIWESAGKLAFESQSTAATVNFELVNSVLNTGSHLVFGVSRGEVVIDNSNVNVGTSRQIENQSTMTVKNGSVVNGAVATSSNAKNPGTLIVDNATYAVTGEFSGSDLGTGTIVYKNGATISAGSITKANIQIDATGMAVGDEVNITANLANLAGTIEVINNIMLDAKIVDGKIVIVDRTLQGEGTADNPYLINDISDLEFFRDDVNAGNNYAGKYIKVTATEIDLNNEEWTPIAYMGKTFKGNFDGNNVTVKNLKITKTLTNSAENNGIGFFGRTDDPATIENIIIENVDITGSLYVGAIVGYGYTGKHVKGCTVKGDITIDAWWYAGAIGGNGYMNLIDNCHVIGNDGSYIKGNGGSYIGGIWGFRGEGNNKITNCTVENLDIIGVDRVGGICGIGHCGNTISGCDAEDVTVTATDPEATTIGLLVGATQGNVNGPTIFEDNDASGITAQIDNGDGTYTEVTNLYGTNIDGTTPVTNYVAQIVGGTQYATLAEAVAAAVNNDVITLLPTPTNASIAMAATIVNNKTVTITGTANVDWSKGWLYVGRNGEGNGKLIFNEANLTSKSVGSNSGLGLNVSCKKDGSNTTNDGEVEIINSTIQLDYLIGKGNIKLDNSTLNVYEGFAVGARPASETGGAQRTVTMDITNGSKVIVDNHNGQGLGYESNGIMNIDATSTFETQRSFLITANGTMNVNGGNVKTVGTLTNNGAVNVTGESILDIETLTGEEINFLDGAIIKNSTVGGGVFVKGKVTFRGDNTFAMLYDFGTLTDYYGTTANMEWTVEEGASLTLTKMARYGLGYGDNVTINGSITNALDARENLTEDDRSLFMHGLVAQESSGYNCNSKLTVNNAYVVLGSNNSFGNKPGNYGGNYTFNFNNSVVDGSRITFYEASSITEFTFEDSDVKIGTFMTRDTDSKFTLKNSKVLSTAISNGTDEGNYNAGELTLDKSSLTYSAEFANTGTLNIGESSTFTAPSVVNNGTINFTALSAKLDTDTEGLTIVDNVNNPDYKVVYKDGAYQFVEKFYVAQIGENKYETLQEAVDAVEDGGTITLIANETFTENNRYYNSGWWDGLVYSGDKSFTIDLAGFTISQDGALNDYLMWFKNDGAKDNTITLKNGTLNAGITAYSALATSSSNTNKITINTENINFIGENSNGAVLKIRDGAELNVKVGTVITGTDSYVGIECYGATVNIYDGAEIYQNGTSSYNGCLVGVSGNGTINVYGGYGKGVSGGFIAMTSGGTINVAGGEWIANTDGSYANSNKSVLVAQSNKQYNAGAGNSIVNVTGGTFKGGYNCYGDAAGDAQINISGGNFNADPSTYVVDGYKAVPKDGTYDVVQIAGTQTFNMEDAGWYWFSTYIKFDTEGEGLDALKYELDDDASLIKGQYAFTNYLKYNNTSFWTSGNNALTTLSPSQMYMINTTSDNVEVDLTGAFLDYEVVPVTINVVEGWNWIGYPVSEEVNINNAIPNAKQGDVIKSQLDGYAMYYKDQEYNGNTLTGWYGQLTTLKPGRGYMYQASEDGEFSYTKGNGNGAKSNTIDYNGKNYWFADATQYPNNMSIVAMLSIDGEIVKGNYEVAAFANGECRGSARPIYIEAIDTYVLYMTIYGDEVEELTFMYYDIDKDTEYELSNVMNYSNDAIVGTLSDPYIFSMNILGIGENSIDNINIYPNPTTTDREINLQATCDKVEVFNALGVKVAEYHNVDTLDALETAGIYVIRITNDNAVKHCRLVVK